MRYFWEQMSSNHSRSTDFKLAIPETDLSRIVQWEDVNNGEQYEVYFTQRLGPDFDEVPVILISREAFKRLLRGENALFAEMLAADKEAMKDLYFSFSPDKNHSVIMGLSIEHPNVGQRAIRFIEEHKRTEEHEEWLKKLREVSEKSRALHLRWQQQAAAYGFQFHNINIPVPKEEEKETGRSAKVSQVFEEGAC
jgi:hypothetical protein